MIESLPPPALVPPASPGRTITLFLSYSHLDRVWMQRLDPLLRGWEWDDRGRGLEGLHSLHSWHDKELQAGHPFDSEIRQALDAMNIFVPLVSMQFFASWYVMNVELPRAMERYDRREILVVPILLEDVNLGRRSAFLGQFQPLPAWSKPWNGFGKYARALRLIDDGLWTAIERATAP